MCRFADPAVGGLALAAHNYVRATQDIDFLADIDDAGQLHEALIGLGYRCLQRSDDAANHTREDEGPGFLYAHRAISRELLAAAEERETAFGRIRVVSAEGLIGFKLQAFVNNSARMRDIDDIHHLLRNNRDTLKLDEVRRYFVLFDREHLLDELLADARK